MQFFATPALSSASDLSASFDAVPLVPAAAGFPSVAELRALRLKPSEYTIAAYFAEALRESAAAFDAAARLTQGELARALNVGRATVQRVAARLAERGIHLPTAPRISTDRPESLKTMQAPCLKMMHQTEAAEAESIKMMQASETLISRERAEPPALSGNEPSAHIGTRACVHASIDTSDYVETVSSIQLYTDTVSRSSTVNGRKGEDKEKPLEVEFLDSQTDSEEIAKLRSERDPTAKAQRFARIVGEAGSQGVTAASKPRRELIQQIVFAHAQRHRRGGAEKPPDHYLCAMLAAVISPRALLKLLQSLRYAGDGYPWYLTVVAHRCYGIDAKAQEAARLEARQARNERVRTERRAARSVLDAVKAGFARVRGMR